MTNKVITFEPQDGINTKHRKEDHFYKEIAVIAKIQDKKYRYNDDYYAPIILRLYSTPAKNYACFWINANEKGIHCNGSGDAGGYGWDMESGAAEDAINSAGIGLESSISGVGEEAIKEALKVIAERIGYKNIYIHISHA